MDNYHTYKSCIEACLKCVVVCNRCASSCAQEKDIDMMRRCIQLDMECAAICDAAAQLMSLGSDSAKEICHILVGICEECAHECGKHENEHCHECAEACTQCALECSAMAA